MISMQTFFTALADRTRRRILNLIRDEEVCVNSLTQVLQINQPKISRHLAYLRKAGIVSTRRDGKWIYYFIVEPENQHAAQVLRDTLEWLKSIEQMQQDYYHFIKIKEREEERFEDYGVVSKNTLPQTNITSLRKEEIETYLL